MPLSAAKIRRGKRQNEKSFVVYYKMDQETPGKDFIIKSLKKLYGEGVFGYRPEEEGDIEDIAALYDIISHVT